jgi:hypothetical protein
VKLTRELRWLGLLVALVIIRHIDIFYTQLYRAAFLGQEKRGAKEMNFKKISLLSLNRNIT